MLFRSISGAGKIFSNYIPIDVFNGDVEIRLRTDGKFLAIGTLNITGLSVAARLYGNLSQIAKGEGKFLYLMTAPDQLKLLEAGGEFTFGFIDAKGAEIMFTPPRSGSGLASATFSVLPAVNVGVDYPVTGARVDVAQWKASKTVTLRVSSTDGSARVFVNGKPMEITADEAYLRESILEPSAKVAAGFEKGEYAMASYAGVLSDAQIESLILHIRSLR